MSCTINHLPLEILLEIFKYLDFDSANQLRCVSKAFRHLFNESVHFNIINSLLTRFSVLEIRIFALAQQNTNIYRLNPKQRLSLYYVIGFQLNEPFSRYALKWNALNEFLITKKYTRTPRYELLLYLHRFYDECYTYCLRKEQDELEMHKKTGDKYLCPVFQSDGSMICCSDSNIPRLILSAIIGRELVVDEIITNIPHATSDLIEKFLDSAYSYILTLEATIRGFIKKNHLLLTLFGAHIIRNIGTVHNQLHVTAGIEPVLFKKLNEVYTLIFAEKELSCIELD